MVRRQGCGRSQGEQLNNPLPPGAKQAEHAKQPDRLRVALRYAKRGFRVFPCHEIERDGYCSCRATACKSARKHPRIKDWQILATTIEEHIREWWTQWLTANIGIACGQGSNLLVLDV